MRQIFKDAALDKQFRHQGYVVVPLLDDETVASLYKCFEDSQTPNIGGFHGTMYHADRDYRIRLDGIIKEALEPNVDRILNNYRPFLCNFMIKEPGEASSEMPLHQDWSFVQEPEEVSVHIWCPLVDVNHENGNLAVVPGSHHLSDTVRAFADDCPFREQFPLLRESYLRELPMKAGEAVLFDGRLVHSSPPNVTNRRRVIAQSIGIPKDSPIYHSWRVSPTEVEIYEVPEVFFFDYILHQAPQNVPLWSRIEYAPRQLTADEVSKLSEYMESSATLASA
ncbi:phytanoyl-CoA dioxygenase family protein [bacterium]|nr:phytanoyl-CoA dioxygenase family protein [bacterium]